MKTEQRGRMPLNSRKNPGNAPFFTEIVIANQLLTKKHYLFSTSLSDEAVAIIENAVLGLLPSNW